MVHDAVQAVCRKALHGKALEGYGDRRPAERPDTMLALRLGKKALGGPLGALRLRVLERQLSKERALPQPVHPVPIVRLLRT